MLLAVRCLVTFRCVSVLVTLRCAVCFRCGPSWSWTRQVRGRRRRTLVMRELIEHKKAALRSSDTASWRRDGRFLILNAVLSPLRERFSFLRCARTCCVRAVACPSAEGGCRAAASEYLPPPTSRRRVSGAGLRSTRGPTTRPTRPTRRTSEVTPAPPRPAPRWPRPLTDHTQHGVSLPALPLPPGSAYRHHSLPDTYHHSAPHTNPFGPPNSFFWS